MTETSQENTRRAPWHFWVMGIVALLCNAMGALDYLMTQTRNEAYMEEFTEAQREYFTSYPAWVVAFWALAVWGGTLGGLLLLLRKPLAVPLLLVSWLSMIVTSVYSFALSDGVEVMGTVGVVFSAVIFVLSWAFFLYARVMKTRGILR